MKLTREDREKLAYIYRPEFASREQRIFAHRQKEHLGEMFGDDEKMVELLNNPDKMRELVKKHGSTMEKRRYDQRIAWKEARAQKMAQEYRENKESEKLSEKFKAQMALERAGERDLDESILLVSRLRNRPGTTRPLSGSLRERALMRAAETDPRVIKPGDISYRGVRGKPRESRESKEERAINLKRGIPKVGTPGASEIASKTLSEAQWDYTKDAGREADPSARFDHGVAQMTLPGGWAQYNKRPKRTRKKK
jgi:hypothetical protein